MREVCSPRGRITIFESIFGSGLLHDDDLATGTRAGDRAKRVGVEQIRFPQSTELRKPSNKSACGSFHVGCKGALGEG
jgi:hypothetical protein